MFIASLGVNLGQPTPPAQASGLNRDQLANIQNTFLQIPAPEQPDKYEQMLSKLHEEQKIAAQQEAERIANEARLEQERVERERAEAAKKAEQAKAALAAGGSYANTYTPGQCTWYVASRRSVPSNWGNAGTWLYNAQAAGWSTGSAPVVGAIAQTTLGYYGHVAIVEAVANGQVLVSEMNVQGVGVISQAWYSQGYFNYIY